MVSKLGKNTALTPGTRREILPSVDEVSHKALGYGALHAQSDI